MIIVSLTTIPERLSKGLPAICIESILNQSVKPDFIVVNIPEVSKKGESYSYINAKILECLSRSVIVQFGVKDLGPITKIVSTLDFIKNKQIGPCLLSEQDVCIILVDDDCIYDPLMIEGLITSKKNKPDELVIGTAGRIKQRQKLEHIGTTGYNCPNMIDYIYVDIIETFAGVLYDYLLFKDKETEFIEWISKLPDFVMFADDIVLSTWAKKQGAKLCKIIQNRPIVKHEPNKTAELNIINDFGGNNEKVYDYFRELEIKEKIDKLIEESKNNSFAAFIKSQ